MKSNLAPFYIGQKVIYITGIHMPKNSIHTVLNVKQIDCGHWVIDIGKNSNIPYTYVGCAICNTGTTQFISHVDWFAANSFRPVQEQKFPLISYSKVLEEELICAN